MSDEQKPASAPVAPKADDTAIKNLKAEYDRKIGNLEAMNKRILDQVAATMKPQAAVKEDKLDDAWFDSPRKAADMVKAELREEAAVVQQTNATLAKLVQDFPELNDTNSELYKKAVEIYDGFSPQDKLNPSIAYRAAVREAAIETDTKPVSKRSRDSDDDFSLAGSGGARPRSGGRRGENLSKNTTDFAKIMAESVSEPALKARLNPDTPEARERLKNHSKRTWKHYGK